MYWPYLVNFKLGANMIPYMSTTGIGGSAVNFIRELKDWSFVAGQVQSDDSHDARRE